MPTCEEKLKIAEEQAKMWRNENSKSEAQLREVTNKLIEAKDELKMPRDREQLTCFAIAEAVKPKMELRDALAQIEQMKVETLKLQACYQEVCDDARALLVAIVEEDEVNAHAEVLLKTINDHAIGHNAYYEALGKVMDERDAVKVALAALASELEAMKPKAAESRGKAGEWLPIESAPRDGTNVLLAWHWKSGANHSGVSVVLASWICRKHHHSARHHDCPDESDCEMNWDAYAGKMTHWMPLPPLSVLGAKDGGDNL